jgi:hypothetical protein
MAELPIIVALGTRVSDLKRRDFSGVYVAANWLARRVIPLKKQVHPGCEYSGLQDPTQETSEKPEVKNIVNFYKRFSPTSAAGHQPSRCGATILELRGTR